MTAIGWIWIATILLSVAAVTREVVAADRQRRPARVSVVFSATAVIVMVTVLALAADGSPFGVLGVPRRYATYQPEPAFNWRVLLPAAGVALLAGASIGAIRTAASTVPDAAPAAMTRNRLTAAIGAALLVVGIASLLLR